MNTRRTLALTTPLALIVSGLAGCNGLQSSGSPIAEVDPITNSASPAAVRGDEDRMKAWADELESWEHKIREREDRLKRWEHKLEERKHHLEEWQHKLEERNHHLEEWQHKLEDAGRHQDRGEEHRRHQEEMFHGMQENVHRHLEEVHHRFEMVEEMMGEALHHQAEEFSGHMHEMMERFHHEMEGRDHMIHEAHQRIDELTEMLMRGGGDERHMDSNHGRRQGHGGEGRRDRRRGRSMPPFAEDMRGMMIEVEDDEIFFMHDDMAGDLDIPEEILEMAMQALRPEISDDRDMGREDGRDRRGQRGAGRNRDRDRDDDERDRRRGGMESEFDFEIMIEGDGGDELPEGMREMIMEAIMSSMSDEEVMGVVSDFDMVIEGDSDEEFQENMRIMIMESIMSSMSDETDDADEPKKKRSKNQNKGKQKKNPDR